jgi:phosphate transport system substrate-binding protein
LRSRPIRALTGLVIVIALVVMSILSPLAALASATVTGGGSSFAALELGQWAADVRGAPYDLNVEYAASSSGQGRSDYATGLIQYGASDIIYNQGEDGSLIAQVQAHPFKYVTVSAGGLSFLYNLSINGQQVTGLDLTRDDVCEIFTGEVTLWSALAPTAPADAFLSELQGTPQDKIEVVTRSDAAGESYVLSQYCQAVDPTDWSTFQGWVDANAKTISYSDPNMAAGLPVSIWPSTLYNGDQQTAQASGADAVADYVTSPSSGAGSITYDADGYAKVRSWPVASVENAASQFTQPTPDAAQAALAYAQANQAGTFNLDFTGSDPTAYFPSTYSYVLAPTTIDAADSATLSEFLCYDVGAGQKEASNLGYAPLSSQVTALSVAAIEAMPGAPPVNTCGVGGPAPNVGPQQPTQPPVTVPGTPPPAATTAPTTPAAPAATTVPSQAAPTTAPPVPTSLPRGTTPTASGSLPATSTTVSGSSATTTCAQMTTTTSITTSGSATTMVDPTTTAATGVTTTSSSTTSTTAPCAAPSASGSSVATVTGGVRPTPGASKSPGGVTYGGAFNPKEPNGQTPEALATKNAVAKNGPTNFEALWWLLIGAAICALLTGAVGARKKMAT